MYLKYECVFWFNINCTNAFLLNKLWDPVRVVSPVYCSWFWYMQQHKYFAGGKFFCLSTCSCIYNCSFPTVTFKNIWSNKTVFMILHLQCICLMMHPIQFPNKDCASECGDVKAALASVTGSGIEKNVWAAFDCN